MAALAAQRLGQGERIQSEGCSANAKKFGQKSFDKGAMEFIDSLSPSVLPTQIVGVGIHAGASTDLVCSLVSHFVFH